MECIWWEQIPNAVHFLQKIEAVIRERQSLILVLPYTVPWRNVVKEKIIEYGSNSFPNQSLTNCDEPPCEPPDGTAGSYLLRHFCKPEKRNEYRPTISKAQFLAQNELVLNHRIIMVDNLDKAQYQDWTDTITTYFKYLDKEREKPVFILLPKDEVSVRLEKKGMKILNYGDAVDDFDTYAFAIMSASVGGADRSEKTYLAALLSTFCQRDVELCAACSEYTTRFLQNPADVLQLICQQKKHSNGEPFEIDLNELKVKQNIWKTQVRLIYPILEDFRTLYAERYRTEIEVCHFNPDEVELGKLWSLAQQQIRMNDQDYRWLNQLKEARNKLSHRDILNLELTKELLKKAEQLV